MSAEPQSTESSLAVSTNWPVDRSTYQEDQAYRKMFDVVWDGIGPLTMWPECDWKLFRDSTWQPIFDRAPRTSSELLARWVKRQVPARFDHETEYRRPFSA